MELEKTAPAVLSGAYERRRGYLSTTIVSMNYLAVTATLAIWGFSVRWETGLGQSPDDWQRVAIQVAWAGALSSILIGLWRFYAHYLDHAIIRLYPALYLCERVLLPIEVCTLIPPSGVQPISKTDIDAGVNYQDVHDKDFGGRGHPFIDCVGGITVVLFGFATAWLGTSSGLITFAWFGMPHLLGWLLVGNGIGLVFISVGYVRWRNCKHKWPVPKAPQSGEDPVPDMAHARRG